uniref:Chitin-binding type-1 domain-containing protein n=1 Tax=Branchiostoma floridae TaxID=7739 RepID=C3ZNG1_BRAFL|eukprot:XP_002589903.1 hypothetical protein BRAFLDRAFT_81970 [Branchiostoma floridae]
MLATAHDTLDRKVGELTRSVSDLQLGQEYLQQVILYGRDEKRLRNMLDTHAEMEIRNGQYELPGHNIQAWADSVLSYRSDGVDQVLYNLLDMVKPHSGVFGGKSLMEICHLRLIDRDNLEKYTEKMQQKAAQVYGLIGGGYAVWITALRIKDRASEIPAKTREMKSELSTVGTSLLKYTKPKNWRADWRCGPAYPADNGKPAKCHPDSKFPCCSPNNWCGNTANHCGCAGCVDFRGKAWRDDLRCGAGYPAPNGQPAKCDPDGKYPCCSPGKWCGKTTDHCDCSGCVDYREKAWRDDFRCGAGYPAPNGQPAKCDPDGIYPCCSKYNWCGNTADHCDCSGCVNYFSLGL